MKTKKKSSQSRARERRADKLPFRIPPILLEGDESGAPATAMGPGEKYALGPAAPARHFDIEAGKLPEAYGTRTLLLTAREPHWLYAHWDISRQEQRQYSAPAAGQDLVLRIYERALTGSPAAQIQLHPDSRDWSVYVPRAGTQYVAELGRSLPGGLWERLATSGVATTPPETVSPDNRVQFATVGPLASAPAAPVALPAREAPTRQPASEPAAASAPRPPDLAHSAPPANRQTSPGKQAQEPEPAGLVSQPAELLEPGAERNIGSQAAAGLGLPAPVGALADLTSPGGQPWMSAGPASATEEPAEKFWFNINAELVLYGATEPDAEVAIAGEPIRLRPDGTFSYRFALPDGDYDLLATAISAHNDLRQVRLQFSRRTD
jgi:hypothetical protein